VKIKIFFIFSIKNIFTKKNKTKSPLKKKQNTEKRMLFEKYINLIFSSYQCIEAFKIIIEIILNTDYNARVGVEPTIGRSLPYSRHI
jgi:hypothetical protein